MNKVIGFFMVKREGLTKRWWHRLANVLIYGSILLITGYVIFFIFDSKVGWTRDDFTAYSFESDFASAKGVIEECKFYSSMPDLYLCGDMEGAGTFLNRYDPEWYGKILEQRQEARQKYLDALKVNGLKVGDSFTLTQLQILPPAWGNIDDDKTLMRNLINSGKLNNIGVKHDRPIVYSGLMQYILIGMVMILGWFIFWESIVYRALVYIILGAKPKT